MEKKIILFLFVFTFIVSHSFADDDDHDRNRETFKAPPLRRTLQFEPEDNGIRIEARAKPADGVSSRLKFSFMQTPFPRFRLEYFTANGSIVSSYKYRFGIRGVVEFNDIGTAGFDQNDTILQNASFFISKNQLESQRWRSILISRKTINSTDTIRFNNTLPFRFGRLTIMGAISSDMVRDEYNRQLLPNAVKFDLMLDNITYKGNVSKIALITSVETYLANSIRTRATTSFPIDQQLSEGELTIGNRSEGRITWVKNVTVWKYVNSTVVISRTIDQFNSSSVPIVSTLLPVLKNSNYFFDKKNGEEYDSDDDEDGKELITLVAFTFDTTDQPKKYFWDPNSQINDGSLDVSNTTATVSSSSGSGSSGAVSSSSSSMGTVSSSASGSSSSGDGASTGKSTNGSGSKFGWKGLYAMGLLLFWMVARY